MRHWLEKVWKMAQKHLMSSCTALRTWTCLMTMLNAASYMAQNQTGIVKLTGFSSRLQYSETLPRPGEYSTLYTYVPEHVLPTLMQCGASPKKQRVHAPPACEQEAFLQDVSTAWIIYQHAHLQQVWTNVNLFLCKSQQKLVAIAGYSPLTSQVDQNKTNSNVFLEVHHHLTLQDVTSLHIHIYAHVHACMHMYTHTILLIGDLLPKITWMNVLICLSTVISSRWQRHEILLSVQFQYEGLGNTEIYLVTINSGPLAVSHWCMGSHGQYQTSMSWNPGLSYCQFSAV